jgi:hypothetical protein
MALDRTWYNALVDDNGDGLSGSVWDKADVDALMDAVDAEIARIDTRANLARTAFTPEVRSDANVLLTVGTKTCSYHLAGDAVFYTVFLISITVPAGTQTLKITAPPYAPNALSVAETVVRVIPPAGASEWGYCRVATATQLEVRRQADAAFAAGSWSIVGEGFYYLR